MASLAQLSSHFSICITIHRLLIAVVRILSHSENVNSNRIEIKLAYNREFIFADSVIPGLKERNVSDQKELFRSHTDAEGSEIENDSFSCPTIPDTSPFASQCTDF
ncbi:hypothetical protein CEXT_214781 [Caerostris extrusa]|uniref:Uncharacterized protein n=1 Tax=Caerostris extrusa TaxID=172846 RepID=A0AAV4YC41_CAEEX|nr:hypothetical protein CEXT_214781 [Caerostris extrusa]